MGMLNKPRSVLLLTFMCVVYAAGILTVQSKTPAHASGVTRSVVAVGYSVGCGETNVDCKPLNLFPGAKGKANVEASKGITNSKVEAEGLTDKLSIEFLTGMVWAFHDGQTANLGELVIDKAS